MDLASIRSFLGWCTAFNFGVLLFTTFFLLAFRDWASRLHARMFGVDDSAVRLAYFGYLANYKIVVLTLNLIPYLALRWMG